MAQARGAAYAAVYARHALYKVFFKQTLLLFEQGNLALGNAVAGYGVKLKLILAHALLLKRLGNGFRKAAAAGEYAAVEGRVVKLRLLNGHNVYAAGGEHGLHFLKRDGVINIFMRVRILGLALLGYAGPNEYNVAILVRFVQPFGHLRHGGEIVRNIVLKVREMAVYVVHKRRAAGGGKEALLNKLLSLKPGYHVRAPRGLYNGVEAQGLYSANNLLGYGVGILACHAGGDNGINMIILVAV